MRTSAVAIVVLLLAAAPSRAEELQLDSWSPLGEAFFQQGLVTGEIAAVRLTPTTPCPCEVDAVLFLYGGASGVRDVIVKIWDDSGQGLDPGAELLSTSVQLSANDSALQYLDLADDPVIVEGAFRVGIFVGNKGLPSVAVDDDGLDAPSRNFLFTGGQWQSATEAGLDGDWVIRATTTAPQPLGFCAEPLSNGSGASASDCLHILRTGVGAIDCEIECQCDTNGSGDVTATDALICLKHAVGQEVELDCPCS